MISEFFINIIFGIVTGLMSLLPDIQWSVDTTAFQYFLDVIKVVDHVIDLGPEGGDKGGQIVAVGTPEEIIKCKKSYTGEFLSKYI